MRRRRLLAITGSFASLSLAGCSSTSSNDSADDGDEEPTGEASGDEGIDGTDASTVATFRGSLVGLTAEGVHLADPDLSEVEQTVATELQLNSAYVKARRSSNTVEVFSGAVTPPEFVDALSAAGIDLSDGQIRSGVTAETRAETVEVLEERFAQDGIDASVSVGADDGELSIDVPDDAADTAREMVSNQGRVQILAGYPDPQNEDEPVLAETLTADDIGTVRGARDTSTGGSVGVTLTEEAAAGFAETMIDAGFTREGRGNCGFDPETDEPAPNEHCLYTVVDGDIVFGAAMGGLAETIDPGGSGDYSRFLADPSFSISTDDFATAQQLSTALQTEVLPTEIELERTDE